MQLTDISIRALKAPETGAVIYTDDHLEGFGVRVSQGGTKSFVLTYGRARKRKTIGRVGIITLKQAREKAKQILAARTLGQGDLPRVNFEAAFDTFKASRLSHNKASTKKTTERQITVHFLPKFRQEQVQAVSTNDIAEILDTLKSTPAEQRHAHAAIRLFFNWAEERHLVEISPVRRLKAPRTGVSRARVLTDDELRQIWLACEFCGNFGIIVRLLILTGQRRGEIGNLDPAFFKDDLCTLPASLTKNRREHTFPIGNLAQCLGVPKPWSGWSKSKASLDKLSGVNTWTLHDLRRTLRTRWAQLGIRREVAERYINHVSGTQAGVEGIYDRYQYLVEMREAVVIWEAYVIKVVRSGTQPETSRSSRNGVSDVKENTLDETGTRTRAVLSSAPSEARGQG